MKKMKILIVEDEKIVAEEIKRMLEHMGYSVCGMVSTGDEAIEEVGRSNPDLVLMDIRIDGDKDGIETAGIIRSKNSIPIIYLTAYADEETLQRAKLTEPYGYLLKPFESKDLRSAIEMAFYRYNMERKLKENQQWLEAVLYSISDGVVATDKKGRVCFMNPVAESLTGYKQAEVKSRPIGSVLRIIDEERREEIKDLTDTKICGEDSHDVKNRLLLVSKNKRKIPISISSAPIRDEYGRIAGTVTVFRDITEQRKAERAMLEANRKLKRLDVLKTEFLSTVSHELRTPIAVIQEGIGLCLDGIAGSLTEKQRGILNRTLDHVQRLERLVGDLLDISKIEVGKMLLRRSSIDMVEIATDMALSYENQAKEKGVSIVSDVPDRPIKIYADRDKINQIFSNLMSNALRFTPEGGKITIRVEDGDRFVRCEVEDTGRGIAREDIPKLFKKFSQIGSSGEGEYQGTGLGLVIVKGLVEKHRGRIWVESEPGKGSKFIFTIKKIPFPKIMIVEDDDKIIDVIEKFLGVDDYRFIEARDGIEAIEIARKEFPDLIVLDMMLPEMNGYEVIGRLKQDNRTQAIPILITSAYRIDHERLHRFNLNAAIPILKKPIDPEQLRENVRELLVE